MLTVDPRKKGALGHNGLRWLVLIATTLPAFAEAVVAEGRGAESV